MALSEYQTRLLALVDHVRWQEAEHLGVYEYHLLRRALGEHDVVITFEMERAVAFAQAHPDKPPSPPEGPERSPWLLTWASDPFDVTAPPSLVHR